MVMSGISNSLGDLFETIMRPVARHGEIRSAKAAELRERRRMRKLFLAPGRKRWTGGDRIERQVKLI